MLWFSARIVRSVDCLERDGEKETRILLPLRNFRLTDLCEFVLNIHDTLRILSLIILYTLK